MAVHKLKATIVFEYEVNDEYYPVKTTEGVIVQEEALVDSDFYAWFDSAQDPKVKIEPCSALDIKEENTGVNLDYLEVTFGYILENGDWCKFCELKGYNPYILNEGLVSSSEKIKLTLEEASKIGI